MKRSNKSARHTHTSGSAIPLALLAIVLVLTVGVGLLRIGLDGRIFAARATNDMLARAAADAGLTKALFQMNEALADDTLADDSLPSSSNESLIGTDATFTYAVTINPEGDYVITSTGYANGTVKQVATTIRLQQFILPDIYARDTIELENSSTIGWYNNTDDDDDMTVVTDSIVPGAFDLRNSAIITGDAAVGPTGDPDIVITLGNNAEVTGDTVVLTQAYAPAPIEVPQWLDDLPIQSTINGNKTINSSGKYAGVDLQNSEILTVTGNVTLYITGDINLDNSGEFRLAADAALTLYLGGDIEVKNSGQINNLTRTPGNFLIYGQASCQTIRLKNGSDVFAVINAPEAAITVYNSGDVYGSLIAKTLVLDNSSSLYFDVTLRDEDYEAIGPTFVIKQWRE